RERKWEEKDLHIPTRLAQIYGLQWTALGTKKRSRLSGKKKLWLSGAAILGLLTLCIPVPVTSLAPAEIVASAPFIVTAPMDGVIKALHVAPGTFVKSGTPLLSLDDTNYRNELSIAAQEHSVADARLRRASLTAFIDAATKREIAIAKAERDLALTRKNYAAERLSKTVIRAQKDGLVLYSDVKDWMGRPVATGQSIMEIASPNAMQLRLEAPIVDSAVLNIGARVRLFLDSDPLNAVEAELSRASFYARPQAGGELAYDAMAQFETPPPGALIEARIEARIGARGVAKIYGQSAPLGYWLLRRPITALRQFTGI
ncbi:MAG: HlyD family efflux transporter periplasmic adaptor subunit, partial [Robiginitomaculum sp.]